MSTNKKAPTIVKYLTLAMVLVALVIVGVAVWRLYIAKQANQNNSSANSNPEIKNTNLSGFSFEQPKDWTASDQTSGTTKTIHIEAPVTRTAANGKVEKGAIIKLTATDCTDTTQCQLETIYSGEYKSAIKRSTTTVDSTPAARFTSDTTGDSTMYTIFYKNNKKYTIAFAADDDETNSRFLAAYILVVNSFKS